MKKLALIFTLALFVFSCGKKEETQTTPPGNQQQMTQQQNQQQNQIKTDEQVKQDESKKEEMKKNDEKKKEDDKKKTDDKTKTNTKDESIRNPNEDTKTDSKTSDIDFTPIFAKRCAKCHGKDLKGKKDGGPDLTRTETQNKSDSKLFNIITTGVKADNEEDTDMPSFKGKLTEDEIHAAIKFIKAH
jgi:cytochrome c5